MIRFRNPGTQYTTQIQVFRELYKEYKDAESFGLNEMAQTITRCCLMTAYGYAGDAALSLSDTDDTSRNSTLMNAKMYAEVFRLLGWIASKGKSSYPLVFTYIGEHAAVAENVLPIYEQCVLGINNPQEIMGVKYTEKVRFFKTALFTMVDLNNVIYKHELCLGPMCIDDLDNQQYSDMITALKKLRGSYRRLTAAYSALCDELGVKKTLPDNSTRLPIAFMKTCGWVETERRSDLYAPKSLECLRITTHGMEVANSLKSMKDIRLDEYRKCSKEEKDALIRLGIFAMLKRSGYDVSPVAEQIKEDTDLCSEILHGVFEEYPLDENSYPAEENETINVSKTNWASNPTEVNIILEDTYPVLYSQIPCAKNKLPTIKVSRNDGKNFGRHFSQKFIENVITQIGNLNSGTKVNVFATTNPLNSLNIAKRAFTNGNRGNIDSLVVFQQDGYGKRLFQTKGKKIF